MQSYHRHYRPPPPGGDELISQAWKYAKRFALFLKGQFTSSGEKITRRRLISVTIALMISAFFGELNRALLLTAIPKITTEFQSLDQAAWYQASHDLARLAFLPIFGRVYTLFPLKITYCAAILVFIVGAAVCATSSTSHVLIVGRAIQGVAHAGIHLGGFIIICHIVPTRNMPVFLALVVLMNGIAAGVGPPLGGILVESSMTWRLGFFLSISMAFIAGCLIIFTFPEPVRVTSNYSLRERLKSTDQLSVVLIITSLTALFLALQWGGTKYNWSDPWIWGLLIGFTVMAGLFWFIQFKEKDRALIPIRILTQRTVGFGCLYCTFLITAYGIFIYYMPFYFQAARGYSPRMSGIYILPLAVPDTVVALAVGAAVTYCGHYVPFMVASAASVLVGSGLLSQIRVDTNMSYIVGLELIISLGLGLGIQLPLSAIRNVLEEPDVPAGEALVLFCLSLGVTVAFPIAQAIFMNVLGRHLATGLSAERVAEILRMGASKVSAEHLEGQLVPFVAEAYAKAITTAFYISVGAAGLALIAASAMEWRKLEKEQKPDVTGGVLTGRPPSHLEGAADGSQEAEPIPLATVTKTSTRLSSWSTYRSSR